MLDTTEYKDIIDGLPYNQGLAILHEIASHAIQSKTNDSFSTFLQVFHTFTTKHQIKNIAFLKDKIEDLHRIFNNYHSRIMLFTCSCHCKNEYLSKKLISECYNEIDRKQLECIGLVHEAKYDEAFVIIKELCLISPHVSLFDNFMRKVPYDKEHSDLITNIIIFISTLQDSEAYTGVINYALSQIRYENTTQNTLIDTKFILSLFPDQSQINPFVRISLLMGDHKYQEVYDELTKDMCGNDTKFISSFEPYCEWLFVCAKHLKLLNDLQQKIESLPEINPARCKLLDTLKEEQGKTSKRTYKCIKKIQYSNKLDILYCVNGEYQDGFIASISSLVVNNKCIIDNLHFHICIDSSCDDKKIRSLLDKLKLNYEITNLDDTYNTSTMKTEYGVNTYYTLDKSAYYRIFMIRDLSERKDIDRILYIDVDTLILSDLSELLEAELSSPLYATSEQQGQRTVVLSKTINDLTDYFNSGVLLVNVANSSTKALIEQAVENTGKKDKLIMHDQCALNIAFKDNFSALDKKYNFLVHSEHINMYLSDICILHLSGRIKPWHNDYHKSEFLSKLWYTFLNMFSV